MHVLFRYPGTLLSCPVCKTRRNDQILVLQENVLSLTKFINWGNLQGKFFIPHNSLIDKTCNYYPRKLLEVSEYILQLNSLFCSFYIFCKCKCTLYLFYSVLNQNCSKFSIKYWTISEQRVSKCKFEHCSDSKMQNGSVTRNALLSGATSNVNALDCGLSSPLVGLWQE